MLFQIRTAAIGAVFALGCAAYPQTPTTKGAQEDLTNLDLGDLAKITVTSASKKAESAFGVAAAIYVVTAEDIKRSGAPNIPEALRMVPGIEVAQISATQYAVSARGFNFQYSDKLLVLIDGRSIYNNQFGGVYWEDNNIAMDTIDRIEVIRGPGGTLWGANAVNGVINIITKKATDTKGASVTLGAANQSPSMFSGDIEYGGSLSHGDYRVSVFGLRDRQSLLPSGQGASDQMGGGRADFRYDGGSPSTGQVTLEGDLYRYNTESSIATPISNFPFSTTTPASSPSIGGSALARFEKGFADGSSNMFQATYDKDTRGVTSFIERDNIIDLQAQHGFKTIGNNSLMAGLEYRIASDDYASSQPTLSPLTSARTVFSGFVQDQVQLNKETKLTAGSKVEHDDYVGWSYEPSIRFATEIDEKQTYWGAVSRAVKTVGRIDSDGQLPLAYFPTFSGASATPTELMLQGNRNLSNSVEYSTEFGYRRTLGEKASIDIAAFQSSYNNLITTVNQTPFMSGSTLVIPVEFVNAGNGTTRGLEISTKSRLTSRLTLDLGYAYELASFASSANTFGSPMHEIKELATYRLSDKFWFDQAIYFAGANTEVAPAYTRFDFQLRYQASKSLEASIGARNLGQGNYAQIGPGPSSPVSLAQPAIYGSVNIKF